MPKISTSSFLGWSKYWPRGIAPTLIGFLVQIQEGEDFGSEDAAVYSLARRFDARGYLLSASLPEVTGNNGKITYKPHAIGLSWETHHGQHSMQWSYDGNGRPVSLTEDVTDRVYKTWTYGAANGNDDANKQKGRLIEAVRYNYPPVGENVAIIESYEHENGTAGPSETLRQIQWPQRAGNAQWGPTFRTTMDYDLLGNPTTMGYPTCVANTGTQGGAIPCNDGGDTPAPAATGTWTYNEGLMRTSTLSLGPTAIFTYHDNLQMADTMFGNGLVGANLRGTNGMVRPARRVVGVDENNILWDSGVYAFDEAGNIKSIGTDSYTYDAANRLRSATVKLAGAGRSESYQYNTTDSMTQITNDQFGTRNFNVSTVTNRLLGIGATANDWTYDGAGNTLSANGGAFTFTWEPVNMLTRYREGSKDFVSIYGPGDYRVWIEDRSTGTKYWTSRGQDGKILREFEVTGNGGTWKHIRDFAYGADGIVASVDHDGTEIYYHTDHLGTPRLKTTSSGSPFSYHHYYPYGLDANFARIFEDGFETGDLLGWEKDKDVLSVKYTGHQRERHGNLDYMLGRHYSFITNRFVSVDRAQDGWNLYTFVGNSPIKFIDPTGRDLTIAFSFETEKLSERQQSSVMQGVRSRFVNAGVDNVRVVFAEGGTTPRQTKKNDVVSLTITDKPLAEGRTVFGKNDPPSNRATVSTSAGPESSEQLETFVVNVGSHETGHATRALSKYDGDAFPPGSILNPVGAEPDTVMEQGASAQTLGAGAREFSEGDAELLRDHLNQ